MIFASVEVIYINWATLHTCNTVLQDYCAHEFIEHTLNFLPGYYFSCLYTNYTSES